MKIIYVDDEKAALTNYYYDNRGRKDISKQEFFQEPYAALDYVKEHDVDAAFLDITMPEMDGITLGKEIKKIKPNVELVYVTGYDTYAFEAYKVGGRAYLSKPYTDEELDEVYMLLKKLIVNHGVESELEMDSEQSIGENTKLSNKKIFMKTFGNFDMFIDGVVVTFANSKAKELLALLVDQRGGSVSNTQIFYKLWEGKEYNNATSTYVRRTLRALKSQLESLEVDDLLILGRSNQSVNTKLFKCDYYELLKKNDEYINEYRGYYMTQYSWPEETNASIEQMIQETR